MSRVLFVMAALAAHPAIAGHPPVENLADYEPTKLWSVENGSLEADGSVIRWHVNAGQNSRLAIRHEHPLHGRLRYYDRLQFEYRVASGAVSSIDFNALGHVTGPRQYKIHNQRVAIVTTPRQVWHMQELDLADAYWFPWDTPDGEGDQGFFRFDALAIEQNTVVEIRNIRLVRGLLYLKPDYIRPVTLPLKKDNADGSATYTIDCKVLNTSGQPATITARLLTRHSRFKVELDTRRVEVKAAKTASFQVTATMTAADMASTKELYAEPLRVEFGLEHRPDVTTNWFGHLVRPLSKDLRRQVVFADSIVKFARRRIQSDDADFKRLVGFDKTIASADEFVAKKLLAIPMSYSHVRNSYPRPWVPGDMMPEAVNTETGERRFGDHIAGQVWREYLAHTGQATYHTGLAYLLTDDEKYAAQAVELMRLYARQYQYRPWFVLFDTPYHRGPPIQTSSRQASNSSYGSNWDFKWFCKMASMVAEAESFTDEDKTAIYEGFVRPYATELMKLNAKISNQTDITNHNLLLLGLVFDDATLVHTGLMRDCGLVSRLQDIDDDGFSSEGRPLNYHHAAADEYLPAVAFLENSGLKINYGKQRIVQAVRMPFLRATLSGTVPNAGDCGRGQGVRPSRLADMLMAVAPEEKWLMDIGRGSTLESKIQRLRSNYEYDPEAWKQALGTAPHLFKQAGLAILRSGDTPETQIMLTLDYGRSVFHNAMDRNQITLCAFGKVFTHGTGSLYNAGSGGISYNDDPRMKSFIDGRVSLSNNVLVVDRTSQLQCVGRLLAWSDDPKRQAAVSRVEGLSPGVAHTRAVVLAHGVIVMIDEIESDAEHDYDLVYHNFGKLRFGESWSATACGPLGSTGNYDNIADPQRLSGNGVLAATWDLRLQYVPHPRKPIDESSLEPIHLGFHQIAPPGTAFYTGKTGLNNPNTRIMADAVPTVVSRVRGQNARFITVLEPYRETSNVRKLSVKPDGSVNAELMSGDVISLSVDDLLAHHGVP